MNSKTRLYGLIGHPISHSLSPTFQNRLIEMYDVNACYLAFDITEDSISKVTQAMNTLNICGLNVTVPHKENIIQYLDHLDESAANIRAVNTIGWIDGELIGYNTDVLGFVRLIDSLNIDSPEIEAIVLGAGGAARAVIQALMLRGYKNIKLFNRTISKAESLVENLGFSSISVKPLDEYVPDNNQLIINTTSVGLRVGESPIVIDRYLENTYVVDVIYNPVQTTLLKMATKHGIKTCNGLSMLLYQGIRSFEIWHGINVTERNVEVLFKEMKKIVEEIR
jgi:shikimate dehydrogenase